MKLIIRKDKVFTHIGIYLNNSQIVHFSSETNNFFKKNYNLTKNCCYTFVMWCLYRKEKTGLKDILLFSVHYKFPIFALLLFW